MLARQNRAIARFQKNAGCCRLRGVTEQLALRQNQTDAGVLNRIKGTDRTRQLAFQRAQMIDVLHETRGAEAFFLVENFITDRTAFGQAIRCHQHPDFSDLIRGNTNEAAAGVNLVWNFKRIKFLPDGSGVVLVKFGIKKGERRCRNARCNKAQHAQQTEPNDGDGHKAHRP